MFNKEGQMNNLVDEVRYVNENRVIIYLVDRQFEVVTTNGTAVELATELLRPHFDAYLKTEERKLAS
jgi:hypothetical protein